jgi:regulator of RNase E activity RraB
MQPKNGAESLAEGQRPMEPLRTTGGFDARVLTMKAQSKRMNMDSNWDYYFTRVNDALSSILVDQSFYATAPLPDRPWLVYVWVYFNSPRHDGLASVDEASRLSEIEDALESALGATEGVPVGRITGSNRREFYFYTAGAEGVNAAVTAVMEKFPEYRFDVGDQEDANWAQYFDVLYPSPRDQQRMSNRRVLDELKKQGDRHEIEREIDHCLYFGSEAQREICRALLVADGYRIQSEENLDSSHGAMPYSLVVTRSDAVEFHRINEITLELYELAKKYNGVYDGWGCGVTTAH